MREHLVRVHHAGDAVQSNPVAQIGVVEGHENASGIGDATGFKEDIFDCLRSREQRDDRVDEVVSNLAADAAVGEADHVALHPDDEFGVDIDRAEVVDEDAYAEAVVPREDAIEQRRLSCPEKARQDRDGYRLTRVRNNAHCSRFPPRHNRRPCFACSAGGTHLALAKAAERAAGRYFLNLLRSMPITFAISTRSTSCGLGSFVIGWRYTLGG